MNSKQQGDIGEAVAIAYYSLKGYKISYPLTNNARYDLIIEKDNHFYRVQCKTTNFKKSSGSFEVSTRTQGGNRSWKGTSKNISSEETDLLFVLTMEGKCYEFSQDFFHNKSMITLGKNKEKYKVWEFPLPDGVNFNK